MKKLTTISICFLCSVQLFGQQKNYVKPDTVQKIAFTKAIDSLLNDYFLLSNFRNKNGKFDLQKKKEFKILFDEKAYVIDDLTLSQNKNSILLSDYADIVSLKLSKTKNRLMRYPYKRHILLDSILYDKFEDKYEIPLKLNKIIYFGLNAANELIEKERRINLLMYISYIAKTKAAKIAGIEEYKANVKWLDCNGLENGTAYIFTPCDDDNKSTGNDMFQLDCNCAGEDCLGVAGGTALKGSPCNDKDKNTINDVYNDNCECVGVIKCEPGTPCDDGEKNTYNDIYQEDCSCIGNCLIEGGQVKVGTTCNDKNKNTYNDVYQKNCECAGTDCEGEINGSKIIGTKCEDNNIKTVNDVWVENCLCKGEPGCIINGDTIIVGMPCNDGFNITTNDTYQDDCTCKGEDCRGVVDGNSLKGSKCNDGNPNTVNDVYLDDCTCVGTTKKWSIYTGIGGLGYVPLRQGGSVVENNQLNFTPGMSYGGKLSVLLNPNNSKFYLNAGVSYSMLNLETSDTLHHLKFENNGEDNTGQSVDILFVNLSNFKETIEGRYLQIPLGISYEVVNTNKLKVLIDVLAKPYLQLVSSKYNLEADVQYAGEYHIGNPIILKSKDFTLPSGKNEEVFDNDMYEVIKRNGYDQSFEFSREELKESLNFNIPFAVAGGFSFLFDVGNAGAVALYAHYNQFFKNFDWEEGSEENDLKEFLKDGNKEENGTFKIINEENKMTHFNSTLSSSPIDDNIQNGLEAGLSYFIKIK